MRYLIDGYNLMHAMGILLGRVGPQGLERARTRLLGHLHGAYGNESTCLTVIFDAANHPPGADATQNFHGIEVTFAVEVEEADDLLETLIKRESTPRNLRVVSDDHRIQRAARRRQCIVMSCGDFMDELERLRARRRKAPDLPKPEHVSDAETEHWLHEFGDLAEDPDVKELFDPFGFMEEER